MPLANTRSFLSSWSINQSINPQDGGFIYVRGRPDYSKCFLRTEIDVAVLAQLTMEVIQSNSSVSF